MKPLFAIYLIFLYSFAEAKYVPDLIASRNLEEIASTTLEYSFLDQQQADDSIYLKGEFKTKIYSTLVPALVGVGKGIGADHEASAFTTASVVNVLSSIYLENENRSQNRSLKDSLSKIPKIIDQAVQTFPRYSDGYTYNFYPPYVNESGIITRRPKDMLLFPLWYAFTNIPNDSDTSSSVYSSLMFHQMINGIPVNHVEEAVKEFATFADNARNPMFYNRFEKRIKTGAFMTWLMDEKSKSMPRFPFAKAEKGQRIPFVKNDVDCIVNANVLKMISMARHLGHSVETSSTEIKACEMLNDMIAKDENTKCGVYYPNTYNLAYSISTSELNKISCITSDSKNILVKKIISEQTADGSWKNIGNIWEDPILSTTFALTFLIDQYDGKDAQIYTALVYGMHFLLKSAKEKNSLIYWPEENFFTATAIARSLIMWRSKAFTNASIAKLLIKYHRVFPQFKAGHYVQLKFD